MNHVQSLVYEINSNMIHVEQFMEFGYWQYREKMNLYNSFGSFLCGFYFILQH